MGMDPARRLVVANAVLALAVALHGVDHLTQARGLDALSPEVKLGGYVIFALTTASVVLAWRRHPRAAPVALGVGAWVACGVTVSHFAPGWSAFSDPYADAGLPLVSWLAAGFEAAAGAALAVTAARQLRRRPAPA